MRFSRREKTRRCGRWRDFSAGSSRRAALRGGQELLEEKLSFWRTWRLVSGKQWQQEFQTEVEAKLREPVQPQVENAVQLLETDLRGLWPQLQETMENHSKAIPACNSARRFPISRASAGISCNRFSSRWSSASPEGDGGTTGPDVSRNGRLAAVPAGVAAAGGIVTVIVAMSSAAVADVTGILAASAVVLAQSSPSPSAKNSGRLRAGNGNKTRRTGPRDRGADEPRHRSFLQGDRRGFQPLPAFCTTERKRYEPLLTGWANSKRLCGIIGRPCAESLRATRPNCPVVSCVRQHRLLPDAAGREPDYRLKPSEDRVRYFFFFSSCPVGTRCSLCRFAITKWLLSP